MKSKNQRIIPNLAIISNLYKFKYICRKCGYIFDKYIHDRRLTSIFSLRGAQCAYCGESPMYEVIVSSEYYEYDNRQLTKEDLVEILI